MIPFQGETMAYRPFTTTVRLSNDEPLFEFDNVPLRAGMKIEVSLEDSPVHRCLVMIENEGNNFSVHRVERINNKLSLWPPLKKEPLIFSDVVMGPIIKVIALDFETHD